MDNNVCVVACVCVGALYQRRKSIAQDGPMTSTDTAYFAIHRGSNTVRSRGFIVSEPSVLLCFMNPRMGKIRNKASSCAGFFY